MKYEEWLKKEDRYQIEGITKGVVALDSFVLPKDIDFSTSQNDSEYSENTITSNETQGRKK